MEFFNNNNLTKFGKETLYDYAIKYTEPEAVDTMKIFGDGSVYVKNPNRAYNLGMDIDNPKYINKNFYLNTNKPLGMQSEYVLQQIADNADNKRLFERAMNMVNDLPVGSVMDTGLKLQSPLNDLPMGLDVDSNKFIKALETSQDLGLDGIVVPDMSGTTITTNRGISPENIDQKVQGANINGRPQVKSATKIQNTYDEMAEGMLKSHNVLNNKAGTIAGNIMKGVTDFTIKHPQATKVLGATGNLLGKAAVPLEIALAVDGGVQGSKGAGSNLATTIAGIGYGRDGAEAAKNNASEATIYNSRIQSFPIKTIDDYKLYILTLPDSEARKLPKPLYNWYQTNNGGAAKTSLKKLTPLPEGYGNKYKK